MKGTTLYPLSQLSIKFPALAAEYAEIYKGREKLLSKKIDLLDCSWKDVIFLSTINPIKILAALDMLKLLTNIPDILKFPISVLEEKKFCLYEESLNKEYFKEIDAASYKETQRLNMITWSYFNECKKTGEDPLIFYGVPHILLNGTLDIRDAEVIKYHSL